MYKAIHALTGEEIIILHPCWRKSLDDLRVLDRADRLVCQGCHQPVRVKAGPRKRPHFAHKHLKACSYGSESPEVLLARAALYTWLVERFGAQPVTLERELAGLPRPVDCWVQTPSGSLAYWVVDAGIKLEPRLAIRKALEAEGICAVYVMAGAMLNEVDDQKRSALLARSREAGGEPEHAPLARLVDLGRSRGRRLAAKPAGGLPLIAGRKGVLLSPTERALARATPYDEPYAGVRDPGDPWGTLYYLDTAAETLTAFRGLSLTHRPNGYQGVRMQAPLGELRADPKTGDFVYPGEVQRLAQFRSRLARQSETRQRKAEAGELHAVLPAARPEPPPPTHRWDLPERRPAADPEPLPCATCGQITTDYWSTFYLGEKKVCRCRECLERGV